MQSVTLVESDKKWRLTPYQVVEWRVRLVCCAASRRAQTGVGCSERLDGVAHRSAVLRDWCARAFQEWLDSQKEFASLPKDARDIYVQVGRLSRTRT